MVPSMHFLAEILLPLRTKARSATLTPVQDTFSLRLPLDRRWMIGLAALVLASVFDARADLGAPASATVYGAQVAAMPLTETSFSRQFGRPQSIEKLTERMLAAIQDWSSYDADISMPAIHAVPLEEMQQRLCGGPCMIRAAYVPGEGLYYDATMQPLTNRYHQSIFFHELVHHVQVESGSHADHEECHRWGKREAEAYALQNRFLFALGLSSRVLNPGKICAPA